MSRGYDISVKGREVSEYADTFTAATRRANELARETGRTVRVYDRRGGIYAAPVYRAHKP